MTNLFGINITESKENAAIDGEVFCTRSIRADQEEEIRQILEEGEVLEKKSSLPLPLSLIKGICLFAWEILLLGIIKSWGDGTPLAQGYRNAPWIFWACPVCFVVWLVLMLISKRRKQRTEAGSAYQQNDAHAQKLLQSIMKTLGVPDDAKQIDVLAERYVMKNGAPKRRNSGMTQYVNLSLFAYIRKGQLCLADAGSVWEIPLSSLRSVAPGRKRVSFPDWTKPEPYDAAVYKPYGITANQFGAFFARYYRVEISDVRGEFYLLIPEYDSMAFMELTSMHADA
ncbi:MAG: hypothetical protein IJ055_08970 [Oscillospiraceae bacterium]|nr:hypothetical protein [Oscillospiraceae bacterium]